MNNRSQIIEVMSKERINNKGIISNEYVTLFKAYAHIDTVWAKDYQTAVSSGTQNRIKFNIRYIPVEFDTTYHIKFKNEMYDIKEIYPDYIKHEIITIMAERTGLNAQG